MVKMANNKPQTGANPGNNSGSNSSKNQGGNGSKTPGAKQPAAQTSQPAKQVSSQSSQQTQQPTQFKLEDLVGNEAKGFFARNDKARTEVGKDFLVNYANIVTQERKGKVNYAVASNAVVNNLYKSLWKNLFGINLEKDVKSEFKDNYLAAAAMITGIDALSLEKNLLKSVNGASVDVFQNFHSTLDKSLVQFGQRAETYRIKNMINGRENEVAKQLVKTLPQKYQDKALTLYEMTPEKLTQDLLIKIAEEYSKTQQYEQKIKDLTNP